MVMIGIKAIIIKIITKIIKIISAAITIIIAIINQARRTITFKIIFLIINLIIFLAVAYFAFSLFCIISFLLFHFPFTITEDGIQPVKAVDIFRIISGTCTAALRHKPT